MMAKMFYTLDEARAALGKSAKLTREAEDLREPFAVRIRT